MNSRHGLFALAPAILAAAACAKASQGAPGTPDAGSGSGSNPDASCGNLCDADGDGVPDNMDMCPNTVHGQHVNHVGCSDSQLTPMLEANFPPYDLTWTPSGDIGKAGGLTWTYTGINRGDLFHIWWILCDDPATPCGVTLAGTMVGAGEGWHLDAANSNLAAGLLVETNSTHINLADGTMPVLAGRLTVTIVDASNVPIPFASVVTLHVPARLATHGAEILGTGYKVTAIIEVQPAGTTTWTPYIDYYNAAPTPPAGGTTAVSFGGSFYDK